DRDRGGSFRIAPVFENAQHKQLYLPDTNVLLTRFLSHEGVAEVSDFMPIEELGHSHDLVRRAKTVRGSVKFRMCFDPRFDYGRAGRRIEKKGRNEVVYVSEGPDGTAIRLRSDVPLSYDEEGAAVAEFEL